MNRSRHDNIVPYYCSFVEKTKLWLVMKMLAGTPHSTPTHHVQRRSPHQIASETLIVSNG